MQFRTEINVTPSDFRISYRDPVFFIGSCFTEYVGARFKDLLFPASINPFGVVYNPLSVKRSLELIMEEKIYTVDDLNFHNENWFSWDHHSTFSGPDREAVRKRINTSVSLSAEFLKKTSYLFVSFGTARIYRLKSTGNLVCNCHKVPAREFDRELLSIEKITGEWNALINSLLKYNNKIRFIFTISPVRHWKDGAHGNQISKATLQLAVQELLDKWQEKAEYFPSYEILLDDLRDYRFYADDLVHPNNQAIDYIWEKFIDRYFPDSTKQQIQEISEIIKASNHRPGDPGSVSSQNFFRKQLERIDDLEKMLEHLDWAKLREKFQSQILNR